MSFSDLLKKPLPSAINEDIATESAEEEVNALLLAMESEGGVEDVSDKVEQELDNLEVKTEDSDDDNDAEDDYSDVDDDDEKDLDDIDLSDLSDDELDEMEDELRDSDIDDVVGDVESVELSAEEEKEADDLMSLAGTTELLKSELSADERNEFLESAVETQIAVFEGFLLESDVASISNEEDEDVMTEAKMYNKTTVRFSREHRKAQLYAVALNVSARAHKDPDFVKLQKVQRMRRILKKKIQKKYHAEAVRRMKVYYNRLRSSKSKILSNLGKKLEAPSKKED